MIQFKKIVARAAVLLVAYSPLSNAALEGFPGIPPEGDPNFKNSAQVSLFNLGGTSYLLAATNAGAPITFNNTSQGISVTSTADHPAYFLLTAQFSSNGNYISNTGSLSISGEIPFPYANLPGVFVSGDLLTAKLENFAFNDDTLAFSTKMISGFGTLFGHSESVYLSGNNLAGELGFGSPSLKAASGLSAQAVTTVPIPGAGWLLGSALGIFTLVRRNRQNLESLPA